MALMSNYLENGLANHVFRNIEFKSPEEIWIGLFKRNPTDASANHEFIGKGYKRQLVKFDSPQNGILKNSHDIVFHYATSKWEEATHIALFNSEKGGSIQMPGPLKEPILISKDKNFVIKTHKLAVGFR